MATSNLTYIDRNAASEGPAIAPLAPGALTYTPGKPQFSALAASTLGNAGTSADGFDAIFNSVASIVDGDIASLGALDTIIGGIGFVTGALDAVTFSPIAQQYAAFAKAGDLQLGIVDVGSGPPGTNPPGGGRKPKPPMPPPGGGSQCPDGPLIHGYRGQTFCPQL